MCITYIKIQQKVLRFINVHIQKGTVQFFLHVYNIFLDQFQKCIFYSCTAFVLQTNYGIFKQVPEKWYMIQNITHQCNTVIRIKIEIEKRTIISQFRT